MRLEQACYLVGVSMVGGILLFQVVILPLPLGGVLELTAAVAIAQEVYIFYAYGWRAKEVG